MKRHKCLVEKADRDGASATAAGAGKCVVDVPPSQPKVAQVADAAGNAAAAVALRAAGDAAGVTTTGGRASSCFAIRGLPPYLWRGRCRIKVQECERRSKQQKHLTSSKRSWTRTPRQTQRKAPASEKAARRGARA